jgi:hypothetical protein
MNILVLPVSGGYFPHQLAAICNILKYTNHEYNPDIIFSSSGGNVASYIAEIANFRINNIKRVIMDVNSDLFIQKHSNIPTFAAIAAFYNGTLYNCSNKLSKIMKEHTTPRNITKHEIWSGTFNRTTQKSKVFCNKKYKDTVFKNLSFDNQLFQSDDPEYMDGNIDKIAKIIMASASIPTYVKPQLIDNNEHIDGGISYASPLIMFKNNINKFNNIHLIYINGFNLNEFEEMSNRNIIENGRLTTIEMIKFGICKDRIVAHDIISKGSDISYTEYDISEFNKIYNDISKNKYHSTMIEIYPIMAKSLDILNFNGSDINNIINSTKLKIRFWYK